MLTNLYLVRHAHSIYTPDELGRSLSMKGFADAKMVEKLLENENIHIVISSPYKRAIQTVEKIANFIHIEVIVENGLKERKLSEQPVEDFNTAITKVWEEPTFAWEGGESNITAQKRGVKVTLEILEAYKGKNIVVGTHGNIQVLIMNYFDEKYDFTFWKNLDMPDIYKLTFENEKLLEVNRIWYRE